MYPFKPGFFALRNAWYVAAFCSDITRELLEKTILNEPVVIYRKEDGTAVAVGGRCPHRHFPLGKSCLRGDTIVCGYHGISFGPDGQCVDAPSQQHIPRSYRIPTYPLVEHGLWAFIWMGDPERADPALLPDLEEIGLLDEGLVPRPFYTLVVNGRYQLLNDNLMDLTHLGFLHQSSIGTIENASVPEQLEIMPGLIKSLRVMKNVPAPPQAAELGNDLEVIDRLVGMDSYMPGFHAGFEKQLFPDGHARAGELIGGGRVFHSVTPATPHTTNYFFAMAGRDVGALDFLFEAIKPVLAEDVFATEEIEKMLTLVGEALPELLLKSDRTAVEGRRMLQAMMDEEAAVDAT